MDMVGHQNESVDVATRLARIFFKPIQVVQVIFVRDKTYLAVIAPLDDMDGDIWQHDPRTPRHNKLLINDIIEAFVD
jgi:hypothetical protein